MTVRLTYEDSVTIDYETESLEMLMRYLLTNPDEENMFEGVVKIEVMEVE